MTFLWFNKVYYICFDLLLYSVLLLYYVIVYYIYYYVISYLVYYIISVMIFIVCTCFWPNKVYYIFEIYLCEIYLNLIIDDVYITSSDGVLGPQELIYRLILFNTVYILTPTVCCMQQLFIWSTIFTSNFNARQLAAP